MRPPPRKVLLAALAAVAMTGAVPVVVARQPEPSAAQPASRPIKRDAGRAFAPATVPTTNVATGVNARASATNVTAERVLASLAIVVGLILVLRYATRRLLGGTAASGNTAAVRVLARSTLAPRQQVLLLQVGRRVLVVGDCAGQLATLGQIDDADEVAQLLGQLDAERASRPAGNFGQWFGRARQNFDDESAEPETPPAARPLETPDDDAVRGELTGLIDRVRSLTDQMKRPSQ